MDWVSRIVEERLAKAHERGELDIPDRLKGKPIPGIDESRPDGWWAESLVRRERSRVRRDDADAALKSARVKFWQAESESELTERVGSANALIAHVNLERRRRRPARVDRPGRHGPPLARPATLNVRRAPVSTSASRSTVSSRPTDIRIRPGVTPVDSCSSGVRLACVDVAGWQTSVSGPPSDVATRHSATRSRNETRSLSAAEVEREHRAVLQQLA